MRGKASYATSSRVIFRITPAYAGKSCEWISRHKIAKDHPRLCGEKTLNRNGQTRNLGSPPPMRGKAALQETADFTHGITPAYAGKRSGRTPFYFSF